MRFAEDVCAQLRQSTLLEQEVTETRRRDSGAPVQCPPKMVAGQPAFESPRMCNKCTSLACFQPPGSDSSDWVGAVLWKASPGGSPDFHNGAMIFPLQPFFSGCTPTCPDPRNHRTLHFSSITICVGFSLGFLFCFIDLYFCFCASTILF